MVESKQRAAAKEFVEYWNDKGYEKGESQKFWIQLLRSVLGVENPEQFIFFEDQVHLDHTSFIDARIPDTKVLIEQKSSDKDLYKAIKQSDGTYLNPFQQAKRYITELPLSQHPRWVVTCNFRKFCVYDMERPNGEPQEILLKDLEKEYYRLSFLVDTGSEHIRKEMEVSIKAGELVGLLYDALLSQYIDKTSEETLKSLNILCVRLVFCLYAEDAGIFGRHDMFLDYLRQFEPSRMRKALIELFEVLNTKPEDRDPYLEPELAAFPYVNGGLFANEHVEIPNFTEKIKNLLLDKASSGFDWSDISPTIFGAVFESTLNPETRRKGGMHYTSIENIHKVIDPLFMDELNSEFEEIRKLPHGKPRNKKLAAFQDKIASLNFLDPACGSGNFLTETYISLRKLENEVLYELSQGQITLGDITNPIKVSIGQFYGIEINDFAVTVAKTALWIAESQMMKKTEDIVHMDLDFLPLKTYANIVEDNALRIDWEKVVAKEKLNYIMGNPPFVGYKLQDENQKKDLDLLKLKSKNIDYVAGWYFKTAEFIQKTNIKAAFVSTNSITQGEQVAAIWKPIFEQNIQIDFAHRTFRWDSEASLKAHVFCVIIGFSIISNKSKKLLFENNIMKECQNINGYLYDADNIFIEKRNNPICTGVEKMLYGSEPREGGFLILSEREKQELLKESPNLDNIIKRFVSSEDFINNKIRYCLWIEKKDLINLKKSKFVMHRLEECKNFRLKSKQKQAFAFAKYPYLFASARQPKTDYLLIPIVSSENRRYIPIGYMNKNVIVSNACFTIANASLYTFGILTSNVHNAWMRAVCGRLKSDYRYSNTIVYNNFPWCEATDEQKAKIEKTAQAVLDARELYPECSLADLYDELTMQPELRKAHQENDKAVMEAYGFKKKDENGKTRWLSESETVAELMKMYQKLTKQEKTKNQPANVKMS